MQKVLKTNMNIENYISLGRKFNFPKSILEFCPCCKRKMYFLKHGYYSRYLICNGFSGEIEIRRYLCSCKKCSISFLPDFCLFKFSVCAAMTFEYLYQIYNTSNTLNSTITRLNNLYPKIEMSRQLLYFYRKRILNNIDFIQNTLRQIDSRVKFLNHSLDKKERAREVVEMLKSGLVNQSSFIHSFGNHTNITPLTLLK